MKIPKQVKLLGTGMEFALLLVIIYNWLKSLAIKGFVEFTLYEYNSVIAIVEVAWMMLALMLCTWRLWEMTE